MILVTLSHPNGGTQEALLLDVPRVGEYIQLSGAPISAPSLVVESIIWIEGKGSAPEPTVLVTVRPRT